MNLTSRLLGRCWSEYEERLGRGHNSHYRTAAAMWGWTMTLDHSFPAAASQPIISQSSLLILLVTLPLNIAVQTTPRSYQSFLVSVNMLLNKECRDLTIACIFKESCFFQWILNSRFRTEGFSVKFHSRVFGWVINPSEFL
ncbi:hypothetical protein J6590_079112 [Homalodisca vitripennis]|nr:hypothetical protein J6590_079112 [Homalodisca vitripennis]